MDNSKTEMNEVNERNEGNAEGQWKDDIRTSCMNIFCNFAKFSDEDKEFYISQQNILKILRTVNLLESVPNTKSLLKVFEVDCLLKKVNGKGQKINGKQFMNFIVLLSSKLDPSNFSLNPKLSVVKIIKTFFEPFSNFIEEKCTDDPSEEASTSSVASNFNNIFFHKQIENKLLTITLDQETLLVLDSVYNGIKHLYKSYFHYEVNKYNDPDTIFKMDLSTLLEFSKNFEICPFVLTTNKIAIYFNLILEMDISELLINKDDKFIFSVNREIGVFFTISKFALFLVHMAVLSFEKNSKTTLGKEKEQMQFDALKTPKTSNTDLIMFIVPKLSLAEKLVFFLKNLESSKGIKCLEKKTNKPSTSKMNLVPPKDIIDKISPQLVNLVTSFSIDKTKNLVASASNFKSMTSSRLTFNNNNNNNNNCNSNKNLGVVSDYRQILTVSSDEALDRYSNYNDVLKEIFETYAQIGDKFRNSHMTLSGFTRFLKDCNMVYLGNDSKTRSDKNIQNVKSPIKFNMPFTNYSRNSSTSNIRNTVIKKQNINGKIIESDISLIFLDLTGLKNFDYSEKIKNQFNKNKGYTQNIEECITTPNFNKTEFGRKLSSKSIIPLKLNFNLFLKSFESVAQKLYFEVTLDEAICLFFDNNLQDIIREHSDQNFITVKKNLLEALSYLKREEVTDILNELNPVLLPHYLNYANNFGLIIFDNFFEFYKDFSIFPDIVNLVQMKNIFFTLADFLKTQIETTSAYENRLIKSSSKSDIRSMSSDMSAGSKIKTMMENTSCLNFELFIDSLALAALHTKTHEDKSEVEKIINIADKMCQSKGVNKSQFRSGETFNSNKEFYNTISIIKEKIPNIYGKKTELNQALRSPSLFEDLFEDI